MVCGALCRSLAFDRSAAGLLLYAPPEGGAYMALHPAAQASPPLVEPPLRQRETAERDAGLVSEAGPAAGVLAEARPPILNGSEVEQEVVKDSSIDCRPGTGGAPAAASGEAVEKQRLEEERSLRGAAGIEPGKPDASAVNHVNGHWPGGGRSRLVDAGGVGFCSDGEKRRRVDGGAAVREAGHGGGGGNGGGREVEAEGEVGVNGATVTPGDTSRILHGTAQVPGISKVRAFDTGATAALPRMPPGLALIASAAAYDAVADVARTVGRLASLAGAFVAFPKRCVSKTWMKVGVLRAWMKVGCRVTSLYEDPFGV